MFSGGGIVDVAGGFGGGVSIAIWFPFSSIIHVVQSCLGGIESSKRPVGFQKVECQNSKFRKKVMKDKAKNVHDFQRYQSLTYT
jgi:hypothetical protein